MRTVKPSGKYPALFMQWAGVGIENYERKDFGVIFAHRLRLVYPNGLIEWMSFENITTMGDIDKYLFSKPPCYLKENGWVNPNTPKTFNQAMCIISDYDRNYGYPPMEFIEEIYD